MKTHCGCSRIGVLLFFAGVAGAGVLFVRPAYAQTTVSTFTVQVSATLPALQTGLSESVTFSGPLRVKATVVTDPALPAGVVVLVDGRGVIGKGVTTGATYNNTAFANLSRRFAATDTVKTTFAFFAAGPGSHLRAKTALLTLNLTYNTTTMALTSVTSTLGTL